MCAQRVTRGVMPLRYDNFFREFCRVVASSYSEQFSLANCRRSVAQQLFSCQPLKDIKVHIVIMKECAYSY
jgi:hypothetical protein